MLLHCGLRGNVLFIIISVAPRALPGTEQAFNICSLNKGGGESGTQGSESSDISLPFLTDDNKDAHLPMLSEGLRMSVGAN